MGVGRVAVDVSTKPVQALPQSLRSPQDVRNSSMTKSDLIELVASKVHLPKGKAELIVNCIFDSMEESLRKGERIEIRGFGSFEIRHYKAYEGRNPRTGDPVGVQPKRLPFFKVGKELKERVNASAEKGKPATTPISASG